MILNYFARLRQQWTVVGRRNRVWDPLGFVVALAILSAADCTLGITIETGPSFTPASQAPLAGVLNLTTDVPTQVSVSMRDGARTWRFNFFDSRTIHSLILLGFRPAQTNEITVTVRDRFRNSLTAGNPILFVSEPLPASLPPFTLVTNQVQRMEPGYTLFTVSGFVTIVDNSGQIVWYTANVPTVSDVCQMSNGDLLYPNSDGGGFTEMNLLGQTVKHWQVPHGYATDLHEDLSTDHGTILYLSTATREVSNFPTSATDKSAPLQTSNVSYARVVEISAVDASLLNSWSLLDLLDPTRIDYLCFLLPVFGIDAEHANAVIEDPKDQSLIVSLRNQDAIVKFSRTGQLKWILGPHENWGPEWQPYLLNPVGTPFQWNYGQHAPMLTPQGTLLCYDNGNMRAEPFAPPVADWDNYSRAAEFSVDESKMEVSQVWEYSGVDVDRLYSGALGNATWLPHTGNVLVTFGDVSFENGFSPNPAVPNATIVHIKEVTHETNPAVVFDLKIAAVDSASPSAVGYTVYRSHRLPDLYSHPATPVTDVTIQVNSAVATLQFTSDPVRTYSIEASANLVDWYPIGSASPDDNSGDFSFIVGAGNDSSIQFYRVATQ